MYIRILKLDYIHTFNRITCIFGTVTVYIRIMHGSWIMCSLFILLFVVLTLLGSNTVDDRNLYVHV